MNLPEDKIHGNTMVLGPATVLALSILMTLLLTMGCQGASRQRVLCTYVIDGDTIVLKDGRHLRYVGINAPELAKENRPAEPFAQEAKEANRRLVQGKVIDIEIDRQRSHDRYGRLLAHVYLRNGKLVSEILVRNGLAMACRYQGGNRYWKRLLAAQRSAISRRVGIWSIRAKDLEPYYIANRHSMRFHRPWCPNGKKTSSRNRVIIKRRIEAFKRGYCPCRKCRP